MKTRLLKAFGIMLCLFSLNLKAQHYSAWGHAINETNHMYDSITNSGDSLRFEFNAPTFAFGDARLVMYYEGNFGDWFDYLDVVDPPIAYYIGGINTGMRADCSPGEDSLVMIIPSADLNAWITTYGPIRFTAISASDAGSCNFSRVRMRLDYNYCVSGAPTQFAMPSISKQYVCATDAPYTLSGTPVGGMFSGTNVTGASFNPAGLAPGTYQISYTAIDATACTTTGYLNIQVGTQPVINSNNTVYACNGSTTALQSTVNNPVWFTDAALTNSVSNSSNFITPALTQNKNYWLASQINLYSLSTPTVEDVNSAVVDVNSAAGDDHGGIAVTKRFVYLNGDGHCVRADLNLGSLTSLPIRDGMFSDLNTGKLWSLWSTTDASGNFLNDGIVDALRGMDSNLVFTNEYIYLSSPIQLNGYHDGVFAGAGVLGLYSEYTQDWYVVDFNTGIVTDLGNISNGSEMSYSETWASWGYIERTCAGDYAVIYRDYNDNDIHRRELPDGNVTSVGNFTNLSDMASLTYNPWNNRWYFHYEGGGQLGGSTETLGYADATGGGVTLCPGFTYGCPSQVTVNVPANVTLNLPAASACVNGDAILLSGGTPANGTFSGVGVGSSPNGVVFFPALSGTGVYDVTYTHIDNASGCTDAATQSITVNGAPAITATTNHTAVCLGVGATAVLTADGAGTGTYAWSTGDNDANVTITPSADATYTVTGTDANGCVGTAFVQVLTSACVGINKIDANIGLSIYPNPNNGEFTVSADQAITLSIVNELGQLVNVINLDANTTSVKVNNLSNGIYFITGVNANGSVKQKIVVSK